MSRTYFRHVEYENIAEADMRAFEHYYLGQDAVFWAAYDNARIIAFCGLDLLPDEGAAFLCRAWVRPDRRGRGLQHRMIRLRERYARSIGVERLITYTAYGNCPSANSLIKCGFKMYNPANPWGLPQANYWYKVLI
jgi:GNAT superfamily N-acetyltransferase